MSGAAALMSFGNMFMQAAAADQARREARRRQNFGSNLVFESKVDRKLLGDRPQYEIPQAQKDFVDLQRVMRRQEMPGESAMIAQQEQAGATTRGAAANLSGADAAAVLLGESQQRLRGLRAIGLEAAQYGERQNANYANAVQSMAPWQQEQWQQNQLYPWEIGMNEAQQKWNVGANMSFGGGDQMAAAGIQSANMMSGNINQWQQNPNSWWNNMWQSQSQPMGQPSYQYSNNFSGQMGNMAQQQLGASANLGTDPYQD